MASLHFTPHTYSDQGIINVVICGLTGFLVLEVAEDLVLLRADLAAPEFDKESDLSTLQSVVRKQPFMMDTIMSILALISNLKKMTFHLVHTLSPGTSRSQALQGQGTRQCCNRQR